MKKQSKLDREFLSKPGDTILETIEHLKMSQAELAERMGKTASKINDIISGKEPITINTAFQLEKVFNISADFWLAREATYRQRLARIEENETLECWIPWLQAHPVKELKKHGFLKATDSGIDSVKELLLFYGVVSPKQWEVVYVSRNASFRKSESFETTTAGIASWLRMGELEMKKLKLSAYNKDTFKESLDSIRNLAYYQPADFAKQLQEQCAKAGVAVVYTPGLPKAPISGAARWIMGAPLIQLTDRYKINDRFWFTFFHEAGHILLHGKKEVFLEETDDYKQDQVKEKEADSFAAKWLLPDSFKEDLIHPVTDENIKMIAVKYSMHPGIVVGRLQKEGVLDFSEGNKFKEKLSLFD